MTGPSVSELVRFTSYSTPATPLVCSSHHRMDGTQDRGESIRQERGSGDRCLPVSLCACAGGEQRRPTGRHLPRSGSSYVPALGPWE